MDVMITPSILRIIRKVAVLTRVNPTRVLFIPKSSEVYVVWYESRKREIQIRLINEGRCDER